MIVQFFLIFLLCYQTVNCNDDKASKILSCIQPSHVNRSIMDGSKTWFVSDNSPDEQNVICSHIATTDGIRMCACMCKSNLKSLLKNFDAKWTIPKYQTCNTLEETKSLKLNCYDLVTLDKSRICSCMCSLVKDKPKAEDNVNIFSEELSLVNELKKPKIWAEKEIAENITKKMQTTETMTEKARSFDEKDSSIYVTPSTMNPTGDDDSSFTIYVTTERQLQDSKAYRKEAHRDQKDTLLISKNNNTSEEDIVIIYPNAYYVTTKPTSTLQRLPKINRVARSDENVFYVYPQKTSIPEKPISKSLKFSNSISELNTSTPELPTTESSKLVEMVYAKTETPIKIKDSDIKDTDTSLPEIITLDAITGPDSSVLLSALSMQETSSDEPLVTKSEEISMKAEQGKESDNDVTAPGEESVENKAEDYIEDESVTIAYSGRVYKRVPAEDLQVDPIVSSSPPQTEESTTEKVISSTLKVVTSDAKDQEAPSSPLLLSLSTAYLAGSQIGSLTPSSTTTFPSRASSSTTLSTIISSTAIPSSTSRSTSTHPPTPPSSKTSTFTASPITNSPTESAQTLESTQTTKTQAISTTLITSTTSSSLSTTPTLLAENSDSTTSTLAATTEGLSSAEALKLRRQKQFMEFLKKRSKESGKHRLSATSLKKPATTQSPPVNVRKILLDASQRRAALLKGHDKRKLVSEGASTSTESIKEKDESQNTVGTESGETNSPTVEPTSTTTMPRVSHSLRGGALHRRPLYIRTTKPPADE